MKTRYTVIQLAHCRQKQHKHETGVTDCREGLLFPTPPKTVVNYRMPDPPVMRKNDFPTFKHQKKITNFCYI